jgi:hypothetical protein
MKNQSLLILTVFLFSFASAQHYSWYAGLSNHVTSLPLSGFPQLFYTNIHPGIDASYNHALNKNEFNRIHLRVNTSLFYHRFVQTMYSVVPMLQYERRLNAMNSLQAAIGIGSGLSFENATTFKLKYDGAYKKRFILRPRLQYVFQVQFGYTRALNKLKPEGTKLQVLLRSNLQGNFVKNYVPLLPVNTISAGLQFPLFKDKKQYTGQ